jgi:diacylglycerol kinase (ATP)
MAVRSALFIINKFAGGGFEPKVEGKILNVAARLNVECTIEFTQDRGHATELAHEGIAKKFDRIIAVGGDGTVNEVARALVHTPVPMGIIPIGSGNGLSRHLGIPLGYEHAIENSFAGVPLPIDTFLFNNKLSLNVSGVGFDGHVANMFGKDGKRGLVGYVKLTLKEFLSFSEFPIRLTVDGSVIDTNAFIIAIANSSQYGNNARIAPLASVTDDTLHVAVLKKVPFYASLSFMIRFFSGQVQHSRFCQMLEVKKVEISVESPQSFHVDGEPSGKAEHFTAVVQHKSLNIIVPDTGRKI